MYAGKCCSRCNAGLRAWAISMTSWMPARIAATGRARRHSSRRRSCLARHRAARTLPCLTELNTVITTASRCWTAWCRVTTRDHLTAPPASSNICASGAMRAPSRSSPSFPRIEMSRRAVLRQLPAHSMNAILPASSLRMHTRNCVTQITDGRECLLPIPDPAPKASSVMP